MVTELMLILIVVGAGIVFIVWNNSRKRQRNDLDRRDVEDSTNKFKLELEKTANEIIGKMENQATRLEGLLDESERNRTQLEGRVIELKKLLKRTEGQSTEIRDLLERLDDAVDDVSAMQKQMDAVEKKINAAINVKIPPPPTLSQILTPPLINPLPTSTPISQPVAQQMQQPQPVAQNPAPIVPPQIVTPPTPPPQVTMPTSPQQVTMPTPPPQENFAQVLEKSITEETSTPVSPLQITRPPDRNSIVVGETSTQPVKVVAAKPVKIDTPRRRIPHQPLPESIAERQARKLAERQQKIEPVEILEPAKPEPPKVTERTAKIRAKAVEAINSAALQGNTVEVEVSELEPVETLKSSEKIQSLKSKAATLGEKPPEPAKFADPNADSANIRDMLLSGMTVEEISKETGLGRGAIELVQQMARRQLERK